ncbi:MAG: WecB/TagA/CpsF family glycosyltransferase [Propionivibrio sp.]
MNALRSAQGSGTIVAAMAEESRQPEISRAIPALVSPGRGVIRTLQGVNFQRLTVDAAIALLDAHVQARRPLKVAIANAHTLNLARTNARYRRLLGDFTLFNDGIGVELASRLRYGVGFPANLNGTDFLPAYLAGSALQLRVFLVGARPPVVAGAFAEAQRRFPQHLWQGCADGYAGVKDEAALCAKLRAEPPDLLLVAMGNPLQEQWIARCASASGATVCVGVGALFDFLAGEVRRAPRWVRGLHLEWGYRLVQEPRRLWRRYLLGNASFLWHAWRERK